jgi:uncharacterized damage-inducible protein DinB
MLNAAASHPQASEDVSLPKSLHHIVATQRAFLSVFLERPFDPAKELGAPGTLAEVEAIFRSAHNEQIAFVNGLDGAALGRTIDLKWIRSHPSIGEALMQVVMHSQGHRAQCASRLRALGGGPPMTDFIVWLTTRPAAAWSSGG